MDDERTLIARLREIEALFVGTPYAGEREAAANAKQRVLERLRQFQAQDPLREMRFSMDDAWQRRLFVALLQRYDIKPYRYAGQRYTTVMARVSQSFVDETLWPQFLKLSDVLETYLSEVTERVIKESIFAGEATVEERSEPAALTGPGDASPSR
jgi:hypothetical protein